MSDLGSLTYLGFALQTYSLDQKKDSRFNLVGRSSLGNVSFILRILALSTSLFWAQIPFVRLSPWDFASLPSRKLGYTLYLLSLNFSLLTML
jgi:hypothetical protein